MERRQRQQRQKMDILVHPTPRLETDCEQRQYSHEVGPEANTKGRRHLDSLIVVWGVFLTSQLHNILRDKLVQTGQSELTFNEVKLKEYVKNEFIGLNN